MGGGMIGKGREGGNLFLGRVGELDGVMYVQYICMEYDTRESFKVIFVLLVTYKKRLEGLKVEVEFLKTYLMI